MNKTARLPLLRSRFAALRKTPAALAALAMPAEFTAAPALSRSVHVWKKSEEERAPRPSPSYVPELCESLSPRDFTLSPEDEALSLLSRCLIRCFSLPDMGEADRAPLALPFGEIGR